MNTLLKKKPSKVPPGAKKKKPAAKKSGQEKFSLKHLLFGEEKPDLTELESGSTTILDILSPTTVNTKSRDYIVVDGVYHAYLYVTGYGYATTVGSCWLAPLVEAGEGVNLSFIFKRQPKDKILSKIAQTTMGSPCPASLQNFWIWKWRPSSTREAVWTAWPRGTSENAPLRLSGKTTA